MSDERNCPNCIHKKEHGCEMWECDYSPKDDCISRQAVIESICKQYTEHNAIVPIWLSIGDMPSVTPTERTGHWERVSIDKYIQHAMAFYRCSECGNDIIGEHNYCPNCGCRMEDADGN